MTPEYWFSVECENYRKRFEGGDYTALMELIFTAQANEFALPEWVLDPVLQSLDFFFKKAPSGKKGKPGPYKEMAGRFREWERYNAMVRAIDERRFAGIKGKHISWAEAEERASELLVGTPWHGTPKTVSEDYATVKKALESGNEHLYPFR